MGPGHTPGEPRMHHWSRYTVFRLIAVLSLAAAGLGYFVNPLWYWALAAFGPLAALGVWDLVQKDHSILRNYPIIGHIRFLLESVRPELRQYLIEDERDQIPFSREQRSLVYQRAKDVLDKQPFGTLKDVNAPGYGWIAHSLNPVEPTDHDFRVWIGGTACKQPYRASVLNISGTSFGAVSGNAVEAFNKGAAIGRFAHNTGEGSISPYHRKHGGDLIWQVATGYFGCRTPTGKFDPEAFKRQAAIPQVKMIEIKLSQGAKPGQGGVLPKAKISAEIAATRGVSRDQDCVSPAAHSEFKTPVGLMDFIVRLRDLSGGKPIGLKLAVGHPYEFMAIVKAMIQTGVSPDFIVVDGGEGGTGAAPVELMNHVGAPLNEGLSLVHDTLIGAGVRDRVRLGASGKIISAYDLTRVFALGADYVMSARGFMFSVGCIQARSCHTNNCPTGVATQDQSRQKALNVEDKAQRVANFHRNTLKNFAGVLGAAGLEHPSQVKPMHLRMRQQTGVVLRGDDAFMHMDRGALLTGDVEGEMGREWRRAQADSFEPADV